MHHYMYVCATNCAFQAHYGSSPLKLDFSFSHFLYNMLGQLPLPTIGLSVPLNDQIHHINASEKETSEL